MLIETKRRSLLKSISFRIVVIISDTTIIYLITRRLDATIFLTVLTNSSSTILYFLHERFWNKVTWGRVFRKAK